MKATSIDIGTLNLKTGEIDLSNTHLLTVDELANTIHTMTRMREAAYLMTPDEIEESCEGGLIEFSILIKNQPTKTERNER